MARREAIAKEMDSLRQFLLRTWPRWFAIVCAIGCFRIAFYYLVYEPVTNRSTASSVGEEFEPLRPLLAGQTRVAYLSDEPLDSDPFLPRSSDVGDMMYARAQYALAPVILAHGNPTLPLALANFRRPEALDELIAGGRVRVVLRPTATVALLRFR